jgi:uncharacterized membrane protein
MSKYAKLIAALVAALTVLGTQIADNNVSTADVIAVIVAFLGALGVYAVPNKTA